MSNLFERYHITRRRVLGNMLGLATVSSLTWYGYNRLFKTTPPKVNVYRPGLEIGHAIRDARQQGTFPAPSATWHCDLLIAGSGASALTAAWKLKREGVNNFIMLEGPEPNGNNAGIINEELSYPTAAHYLALPSPESTHIKEMLSDIGVLIGDPYAEVPEYDERVLIHALEERLLRNDKWQEGMLPEEDEDTVRFFKLVEELSRTTGDDGKPLFAIPLAHSSSQSKWLELDRVTFAQWLQEQNYSSESLLWYLNYCCRDDYGQGIERVSAWAGLHYFASRTGEAKNVSHGAVLTWPDGLATLNKKLREYVGFERHSALTPFESTSLINPAVMDGTVLEATEYDDHVELLVAVLEQDKNKDATLKTVRVITKKMISAMPLYIASRVIRDIEQYGFDLTRHLPEYGPWIISSFVFNQYPKEKKGVDLAWDNVVLKGAGLGYVVSTHQLIRAARPARTAFTTYYALDDAPPTATRMWLMNATDEELIQKAATDLEVAYSKELWQHLEQIDITIRGHAMAGPTPGYLNNQGAIALRENNSRILFAHSDLSGYSVIEEAAWWGVQAALKYMNS